MGEPQQRPQGLDLPGLGRPLNYLPKAPPEDHLDYYSKLYGPGVHCPFPSALNPMDIEDGRTVLALTTLREFTMLQIMNQVTDKRNWHLKVFDKAIVKKWKDEAKANEDGHITEKMIDYVVHELRYKTRLFNQTGAVTVYTGDVVKSDSAVPASVRIALQTAVKSLENIGDGLKDWHPGSDGKVLDLVHPSLFPLIYGTTRVVDNVTLTLDTCTAHIAAGTTIPVPSERDAMLPGNAVLLQNPYSRKFQWLPCEVDISGEKARITSHINNLHPHKHKRLYGLIEDVIDASIPLWSLSLEPTLDCAWKDRLRIGYRGLYYERDQVPQAPDAGTFVPPEKDNRFDLRHRFLDNGLQIIVKLANIQLTPEKPDYSGGSWHVEGQLNEHICATALYYYSNENITPSRLSFRQQSDTNMAKEVLYQQDAHEWLTAVFGCNSYGPGVQVVGSVDTREGRLVTFPNILQHQVQPFRLVDPTKPGHRKILALFLVDPHTRIISTAHVPPQQKEWWQDEVKSMDMGNSVFPSEIEDLIFDQVKDAFPIALDEAKLLRKELMEERKSFEVRQDGAFQSLKFSLCEH